MLAAAALPGGALRQGRRGCAAITAAAEATVARTSRLFINNSFCEAEGGAVIPVVSPADGKEFATIAHASAADVGKAVEAARACFDSSGWPATQLDERAAMLRRIATSLREPSKLAELSLIESRDCGKTLEESSGDITYCADLFDYFADILPAEMASKPLQLPPDADFSGRVEREPLGVVGCVTPWNFPLMQAVMKVAPALAAGCTVVLKPSPLASLTCCAFGEIVADAGVPAGAYNVITGGPPEETGGSSTGQMLIDHPGLDKLSFTGSGVAGQRMLEASSRLLRPTSLELGGKSAFVIFEDADEYLDAAVDWIMFGIFSNCGQVCSATSRVLVHRDIEGALVERLMAATAGLKVGNPLVEGTQMGPLVSKVQQGKVLEHIRAAEADGCTVHKAALDMPEDISGGFYVPPVILTNVPAEAKAWREEIFGPVLSLKTFTSEEEAVQMANATPYGLANAVYSADASRCARVASRLRSGIVWENCSNILFPCTPFGGRPGTQSGFGHEGGAIGLGEYISEKTVVGTKSPSVSMGAYVPPASSQ